MKQCTRCGNTLTADATYCHVCNTAQTEGFEDFEQSPQYSDTFLKVLCILTIVGASFGIISGLVSMIKDTALPIEGMKLISYLSLVIVIVKLVSAIAMLKKKLKGLYIYSVAAVLTIVIQIVSVVLTAEYMDKMMKNAAPGIDSGALIILSTAIAVLFYVAFLIMYWLPVNRRLLS